MNGSDGGGGDASADSSNISSLPVCREGGLSSEGGDADWVFSSAMFQVSLPPPRPAPLPSVSSSPHCLAALIHAACAMSHLPLASPLASPRLARPVKHASARPSASQSLAGPTGCPHVPWPRSRLVMGPCEVLHHFRAAVLRAGARWEILSQICRLAMPCF